MIKFIKITQQNRILYCEKLSQFEKIFSYAFGSDSFSIEHGKNYFAFFDRLGESNFFIALDNQEIIMTVSVIIRHIKLSRNSRPEKIGYICDLKIHPEYRGRYLIQKLTVFAKREFQDVSDKFYAISMDQVPFSFNRLLNITQKLTILPLSKASHLVFYLLSYEQGKIAEMFLKNYFKTLNFISLSGQKDLILKSNSKALPFLHLSSETQNSLKNFETWQIGFQHMFCIPSHELIIEDLAKLGISYFTTATILQHGINTSDWRFIYSCDI